MVKSIAKEDLAKLPIEIFPGRIIVVQNETEAIKACNYLKNCEIIGFDTETRPAFKKGVSNKIALMQLSTDDTCFLFRMNTIGLPDCLVDVLIDTNIKKIGLSLKDDFSAIRKRKMIAPVNFIELQAFVKQYGIEDSSLQRVYAILFDKRISKGQRLSNWEADILSDAQKMYASIDAWACLRIYNKLKDMPIPDLMPKEEKTGNKAEE